jgi:signal peptidase I
MNVFSKGSNFSGVICLSGLCCLAFFFPLTVHAACPNAEVAVHGSSLAPLVKIGQTVSVSPPSCAAISRGDLVLFKTTAHRQALVIKRVGGLPGDRLAVAENGAVIVNDTPAPAPDGKPYIATTRGRRRIGPHAGVIPPGAYLVLGKPGTLDSGRLGLVVASDIVGVVKMKSSQ